jgi:hypothetical protein
MPLVDILEKKYSAKKAISGENIKSKNQGQFKLSKAPVKAISINIAKQNKEEALHINMQSLTDPLIPKGNFGEPKKNCRCALIIALLAVLIVSLLLFLKLYCNI